MGNCSTCPSQNKCGKNEETCGITMPKHSQIKKVIAVMSGKGGVGKSTVSVLLARQLQKAGYKVGLLDADITGPSIPRLLGLNERRAVGDKENHIFPVETSEGIKTMSLNYLVEHEEQPVIWRGPVITNVVKQFWEDVLWGELDFLIVDMPPGTGDVALTVMQLMPITGIVMVSIPQDMVSMIVTKAIHMAQKMNIPILGVIENMSYILCPDCQKKIHLYDEADVEQFLKQNDLPLLAELPMTKGISKYGYESLEQKEELVQTLLDELTKNLLETLND